MQQGCSSIMATLYIQNSTASVIHVRVTLTGSGTQGFYDIQSGQIESWDRDYWEVAFVLRDDDGTTQEFVVKPGQNYTVG